MSMHVEAVKVHVTGTDIPLGQPPAPRRPRQRAIICRTIVLSADEPYQQIFGPSEHRVIALVQAGGNDIVLCTSQSQAQKSANTGDTTLAAPDGTLLPYTNTAPYPLDTTSEMWAAASSYPAQLAVTVITEGPAS